MEAGILNEVLTHGGGDGGHIADMLHHGGDGDGSHHQNGGDVELGDLNGGQAQPAGLCNGGEAENGGAVGVDHAAGVHDDGGRVGDHHAQQDRDDLEHTLAPDVEDDDDRKGDEGQGPALGGVGHRRGGQVQADADDDGAGNYRGQEAHDLPHAHHLHQQGQDQVEQAGRHNAAAGIGQLVRLGHAGVDALIHFAHGLKAAQEGKGGAQEGRDLQLGAEVEEQCAHPGKKQGGLDVQGQIVGAGDDDGDQDGGAEHSKHVLDAQQQHLGQAKLPRVADGFGVFFHKNLPSRLTGLDGPPFLRKKSDDQKT